MNSPILGPDSETAKSLMPARRAKSGLAYAEGITLATEALRGTWPIEAVVLEAAFAETSEGEHLASLARSRRARVHLAASKTIAKLSAVDSPPPVSVVLRPVAHPLESMLEGINRVLILDRVADPGNAGALVRTAVAFGARVLMTRGAVALANDKLVRATAGVCFHPKAAAEVGPAPELATSLQRSGWKILALDAGATQELHEFKPGPEDKIALVVGNESSGIDSGAWGTAGRLRIAMHGRVESLNASISGAIALYALTRP